LFEKPHTTRRGAARFLAEVTRRIVVNTGGIQNRVSIRPFASTRRSTIELFRRFGKYFPTKEEESGALVRR